MNDVREGRLDVRDRLYIGGHWVESASSGSVPVLNPSTEAVVGRIPDGAVEDIDRAVLAARAAFEGWSQTSRQERSEWMASIARELDARRDTIAERAAAEVGMPLKLSYELQVGLATGDFAAVANAMASLRWEEESGNSLIVREPVGVVGAITPWNYPLHQISAKVASALAAGCTIVVKPSPLAALTAFMLADIVHELGLPPGVFNLVSGKDIALGEALAGHPEVDMISFTGSTRAGRRVSEIASASVKRVALELGGKSPNVILDDADLDRAIVEGVDDCYLNSGQTCSALTRMLVPRSRLTEAEQIATAAAEAFRPGDPFASEANLGPLISHDQRERVREYIRKGEAEGAKLLTGGAETPEGLERGFFVKPTVFSDVTTEMTLAQEEIFGPVLVIMPYDDEEHALQIANDSQYGLAAGVWSGDEERAIRVGRRLRAGQVQINGGEFNPEAPFGGYKQSGHGREQGRYGIEEFLTVKALQR